MSEKPVGWVDPNVVEGPGKEFLKVEGGKTARVKLLALPTYARVHFIPDIGFVRSFSEHNEETGEIIKAGVDVELLGKDPQVTYMAPVLVYDTDAAGNVLAASPKDAGFRIMLWTYYTPTQRQIFKLACEWGGDELMGKDLLIEGIKRGQYVNLNVSVAAKDSFASKVGMADRVEKLWKVYRYRDIDKFIARTMTEEEFREAIGSPLDASAPKSAANPTQKVKR